MTVLRLRNDTPVIPRPLYNSATEEIANTANRADQRSARHVRGWLQQSKLRSVEMRKEKDT